MRARRAALLFSLVAALWATPIHGQVAVSTPTPEVTGPIPGRMFFATTEDLPAQGYLEEEFFIDGAARQYALPSDQPLGVDEARYPFRTRVLVRRPVEPSRFNGTVLVEWLNVTVGFDIDIDWILAREHILRSGYAWVGVSAQRVGVHGKRGLRNWDPNRYGSLDLTADSTLLDDELQYDVFAQALAAVRNPAPKGVLGPLTPEVVIVTGHSQSANRLAVYHNRVHPLVRLADGFVIHGGGRELTDLVDTKVFKINAETDLAVMGQFRSRQPDSDWLRTWEVAGTSHADAYYMSHVGELQLRDLDFAPSLSCDEPPMSHIPFRYVLYAVYDHLVRWITDDSPPPRAEPLELASTEPEVLAARDSLGNALGGIQLPQHAVPLARNTGRNGGGVFCQFFGTHVPFDETTIQALYPTRDAYLNAFRASVEENLAGGFILPADAQAMLAEAEDAWPSGRDRDSS